MTTTSNKPCLLGKLVFTFFLSTFLTATDAQYLSNMEYLQDYPLPSSSGYERIRNDIAVDNTNNTYIAFQRIGLGKFNGSTWTIYNVANGALLSDTVTSVAVNASGDIYAGTANGLSVFDNNVWTHYNSTNSPLPVNGVTTVELHNGYKWVGTNSGLFQFDGFNWTAFNTSNSGLGNDSITDIAFDGVHLYAGTRNGLYHYNGITWSLLPAVNALQQNISDVEVNANEVWIALTDGSIYYYDPLYAPHLLPFPAKTSGCTDFNITNNASHLKTWNGNIYFFITDPNRWHSMLCRTNQFHTVFTYLKYIPQQYNGNKALLLDINNGLLSVASTISQLQPAPNFFSENISSAPLIPLNADFLEYSNLNINKVDTRINNNGDMHWDPVSQINIYEVPACSGKNSIYSSGLWISGLDDNNQIHAAAMTYSQSGAYDFQTGPLDTTTATTDSATIAQYNRTWKVNKTTIDDFIYNYQLGNVTNGAYLIPEVITNWPAHGTGNLSRTLAPFVDVNGDGVYNPMNGDYPSITGDQEIWFVFNDAMNHTETACSSFGIEVHGKAYAFNCTSSTPDNEVMNYTTFYQYKIINRSNDIYTGVT
ncbi:MAG: hypothetical protein ABI772_14610, partial [Bacteroidota bacterium]